MDLEQKVGFDEAVVGFKQFADSISEGILVIDNKGRIIFMNDKAAQEFAPPTDEDPYYKTLDYFHGKGLSYNEPVAPAALRARQQLTRVMHYRSGRKALVTATPVLDGSGQVLIVVSTIRDVTELFRLQEQLEGARLESDEYRRKWESLLGMDESFHHMRSKAFQDILDLAGKVANYNLPVLITGESGVGKTLLAKFIHKASERGSRNFVHINCSSIPEHLLESELFGYEPGAFTGATKAKVGLLELAHGGTVLLDEIAEMSMLLQVKLLNFLHEPVFYKLGGTRQVAVDVRVIAATNADLEQCIARGRFREDLYYRINTIYIDIPPLRSRREDVLSSVFFFLRELNEKYGRNVYFSNDALEILVGYAWPGNMRQLRNIVERAVLLSEGPRISAADLPAPLREGRPRADRVARGSAPGLDTLDTVLRDSEMKHLEAVLRREPSMKRAAAVLGIDVSTLYRKVRRHSLKTGGGEKEKTG